MLAIGAALSGAAGVDVHVGDDAQAALPADIPKPSEIPAVKMHDAGVERSRVEIVVQDEVGDAGAASDAIAEQECSAFTACIPAALTQLRAEAPP